MYINVIHVHENPEQCLEFNFLTFTHLLTNAHALMDTQTTRHFDRHRHRQTQTHTHAHAQAQAQSQANRHKRIHTRTARSSAAVSGSTLLTKMYFATPLFRSSITRSTMPSQFDPTDMCGPVAPRCRRAVANLVLCARRTGRGSAHTPRPEKTAANLLQPAGPPVVMKAVV